jgi:hypothetical protein
MTHRSPREKLIVLKREIGGNALTNSELITNIPDKSAQYIIKRPYIFVGRPSATKLRAHAAKSNIHLGPTDKRLPPNNLADVIVMNVTVAPATRLLNVLVGLPNTLTISMPRAIGCPIEGMHAMANSRISAPVSIAIERTVGVVGCISPHGND